MSDHPKVYIAGMGMITSIGGSAVTTAAAVRARRKGFRESNVLNKNIEPMKIARVPDDALPPLHEKLEQTDGLTARRLRLLRVITPAIEDTLSHYTKKAPIPLFLAGPEALPGRPAPLGNRFMEYVMMQTGASLDLASSRSFATGRTGGLQAIDMAFKYFASTGNAFVLVGGADTVNDLHGLRTLDNDDRIKAEAVMDGFIPGEAAGFLLLATEQGMTALGQRAGTRLSPPGLADEPGHRYSKEPYHGDGLADAFRLALANVQGQQIKTIYSSLNGEHLGAKELGVAQIRNGDSIAENVKTEHPADGFGDIGAAFGPVLVALAALDLQKGWRPGPALVYCASEQQYRAAVCVNV